MRVTWKDGIATACLVAAGALYLVWESGTAAQGMSVRALSGVVFALGWVGCTSDASAMASVFAAGRDRTVSKTYVAVSSIFGAIALVSGAVAIVAGNETMLGLLVFSMAVLWAMATSRHALGSRIPHVAS